jgi:3D (Asp-Asp-Asp) domain-containing protein
MSNNVIDVFVDSYDEAIQFGRRKAEVYVID